MKEVSLVPKEGVIDLWATVEPMLARALAHAPGRWMSIDVLHDLLLGRQSLWIVIENSEVVAAYTTRIMQVPGCNVLVVEWLGGADMYEWIDDAIQLTESYAKDVGCSRIEAHGRRGWKKFLDDHGWKELAVTYEKDLTNG